MEDDCTLHPGGRTSNGYGRVYIDRYPHFAHRVAWEAVHGPIPEGMHVCHHCDNKPCVNVNHLFLGTAADNIRDMCEKGRQKGKLTEEQVNEVRRRANGPEKQGDIAKAFGINRSTVQRIKYGKLHRIPRKGGE